MPQMALAILSRTFFTALNTPLPRYLSFSPSRSSQASCSPVLAPLGTLARPTAPPSSSTSTSTVGFPLESSTCRARTLEMIVRDIRNSSPNISSAARLIEVQLRQVISSVLTDWKRGKKPALPGNVSVVFWAFAFAKYVAVTRHFDLLTYPSSLPGPLDRLLAAPQEPLRATALVQSPAPGKLFGRCVELGPESKCWGAVEIPENPPSSIFELSIYFPYHDACCQPPLWMALGAEVLLMHTHVRYVSNR